MQFRQKEQAILSQIVKLLVNEKLVSPEEHLRFLALLMLSQNGALKRGFNYCR